MLSRHLIALAASLVCMTLTSMPAGAQSAPRDARALHDQGLRAFKAGRFMEAGEAFLKAHQRDPSASLLWNAARSFENAQAIDQAREAYTRYLTSEDAKPEKRIRARTWLEANRAPEAPLKSAKAPSLVALKPPTLQSKARPFGAIGWSLIGLGTAGVVGGSVAMILAEASREETTQLTWGADYAETLARHRALTQTTESRELAAWMTYGAALGLMTTGIVLLLARSKTEERAPQAKVMITPRPGGAHAHALWRF